MKILVATHNPAKFRRYGGLIGPLGDLEVIALSDVGISEKVDEPFADAKDNATHKAKFYGDKSNLVTIAVDESVHTNFLPGDEQPGVYVRRLKKKEAEFTDEEVLSFWDETFRRYPQTDKKFIWNFSIAYYNPRDGRVGFSRVDVDSVVIQPFSKIILPGYPMSSFLGLAGTHKPHSELTDHERVANDAENFKNFIHDFSAWIKDVVW